MFSLRQVSSVFVQTKPVCIWKPSNKHNSQKFCATVLHNSTLWKTCQYHDVPRGVAPVDFLAHKRGEHMRLLSAWMHERRSDRHQSTAQSFIIGYRQGPGSARVHVGVPITTLETSGLPHPRLRTLALTTAYKTTRSALRVIHRTRWSRGTQKYVLTILSTERRILTQWCVT